MKIMKDLVRVTSSAAETAVTSFNALEHTSGMISEAMFNARMEQLTEIQESLSKFKLDELKSLSNSIRDWSKVPESKAK